LVRAALIDSNLIGDLSDEDYTLFEETLLQNETRGYELAEALLNANVFMLRADNTNVNAVIYGQEY
jgi:hypothetical protein